MSEYTPETLRRAADDFDGLLGESGQAWVREIISVLRNIGSKPMRAHADAWEAERAALPGGSPAGAWELVRRMKEFHRDSLEAAERRLACLTDAHVLTRVIERWLSREYDAAFKDTPRSTMRWQWCQRPYHPEDDDCACCITPFDKRDFPCECICHDRIASLVAAIQAAAREGGET